MRSVDAKECCISVENNLLTILQTVQIMKLYVVEIKYAKNLRVSDFLSPARDSVVQ